MMMDGFDAFREHAIYDGFDSIVGFQMVIISMLFSVPFPFMGFLVLMVFEIVRCILTGLVNSQCSGFWWC